MSFLQLDTDISLARSAYAALMLLITNLNDALDDQDAKWVVADQELALAKGEDFIEVESDHVELPHFYFGHKPSLIEAPAEKYPNVAVMSYRSVASSDQGDQYQGHSIYLGIECMVIDGPYKPDPAGGFNSLGEDRVNKKTQRMLEAVNYVIETNPTLGGTYFEITNPPSTLVTECLKKRGQKGHGSDYYWQMCRLDYTVNKISASHQF